MSSPFDFPNPYASPIGGQAIQAAPAQDGLPIFAKCVFIADLVLCCLRVPMVMLAFVGYVALKRDNNPLVETVVGEILTGLGIVVFGITADVLALFRKPAAVWLAGPAVLATLGSLAVGIWQVTFKLEAFAPGTPERMGAYIGIALVVMFRLAIIGAYVAGVAQFMLWSKRRSYSAVLR